MQCPNCRKVEKGQWLFANGYRPLSELNVDELVNEDFYDLAYSDLPFGLQWCPVRGFMQLFDDGEPQPNPYHDMLGTAAFGDHSNASSSTHVCPYLALHGFSHSIHPVPSNATDAVSDATSFHQHVTGLGVPSSSDMLNSHGFSAAEPRHNWQQASLPFPVSGGSLNTAEQPTSQLASRLSRSDSGGPQRLGSSVQPLPFIHGSVARAGGNLVAALVPPVVGDARGHTRGPNGHIYQQSAPASALRTAPFAPTRRTRHRGFALFSSVGTNSLPESSGFHGFSVSGSVNRNHQDGEHIGRRFDRGVYGWVREGFAPLPWIPVEGESQWWSPFHTNQNPQTVSADSQTRNFFQQRVNTERVTQGRPENAYQRVPLPRMSPFM
ncbi:E3 ubiquitin-protein ligase IPI1-like isoform X2 [Magnolia sinica]|nr:E3 ubiquitin-protein ligase IPI1-like isoform X2 [Magnolia sinica]